MKNLKKKDLLLETFKSQTTEINLAKINGGLALSSYQKYTTTTKHGSCCPDSELNWFDDDGTRRS